MPVETPAVPRFSVIVPAYRAAHFLRATLPAVVASAHEAGGEVIVADDASPDDTAAVAGELGARVIRLTAQGGPSGARNAGAANARGPILIFLDADVLPHPTTISQLLAALEDHPDVAAVFGSYDADPADRHLVSSFKNLMHHYVHQNGSPRAQTFWTGCGAIRREVFEQVGPFHPVSLTCLEDVDYGHRMRDAGHQVLLDRMIQCKHLKRWKLPGLIRTDVFARGIPWTVMMLRRGRMDAELNLGPRERISALVAVAAVAALVSWAVAAIAGAAAQSAWLLALALFLVGILLWLQRSFYRFLASARGQAFALGCIPLHILYYMYSCAAFAAGHVVFRVRSREATRCAAKNRSI